MITVKIKNPDTGEIKTLNQNEFNRYMSMTNGEVQNWIIEETANEPK